MISIALALRLRAAGLTWEPAPGDFFVVRQPEMAGEPFVLSDMTIQVHDFPTGRVIGFNGTTEWALDSVAQQDTLWLPSEAQLRTRLGDSFERLERVEGGYRVAVMIEGAVVEFEHPSATDAYGQALLHVLTHRAVAAS